MTDSPTLLGARRRFLKTTGLLSLASMPPSLGRQAFAKTAPGPGTAQDIIMADALTLSNWIAQRQVSFHEVMVAYLDHVEQVNPKVNAIVSLQDRTGLLAQADERDKQLQAGQYLGWMHGMPQAPKDLAATVGTVTTNGPPFSRTTCPNKTPSSSSGFGVREPS